jgi:hypothetical protein
MAEAEFHTLELFMVVAVVVVLTTILFLQVAMVAVEMVVIALLPLLRELQIQAAVVVDKDALMLLDKQAVQVL